MILGTWLNPGLLAPFDVTVHTYTHTHRRTHAHTHTHAQTRTDLLDTHTSPSARQPQPPQHTLSHTPINTHTHIHTHMHTPIQLCTGQRFTRAPSGAVVAGFNVPA